MRFLPTELKLLPRKADGDNKAAHRVGTHRMSEIAI